MMSLRKNQLRMFYIKYFIKNVVLAVKFLCRGDWRRVYNGVYARIYNQAFYLFFIFKAPRLRARLRPVPAAKLEVMTDHPVAFASPDHIVPHGTKYNNSTNRKFVLFMNDYVRSRFSGEYPCFMDLGCSGGQLVKDFKDLHWIAVGLEGSDYSLKHRRANWRTLANQNLFTCDIAKPFRVRLNGKDLQFNLITAWEVMEHIKLEDLGVLFDNIRAHLAEGGLFIASTSSSTSIVDGVELHQTRMTNAEWRRFIQEHYADLEPVDPGLKIYQYVRYDFGEPSILVYKKASTKQDAEDGQLTSARTVEARRGCA